MIGEIWVIQSESVLAIIYDTILPLVFCLNYHTHTHSPFMVSSLGDSRQSSRRLSRKQSASLRHSNREPLEGVTEEEPNPYEDEDEDTQRHKNNNAPTNLKDFFKGFAKKTSGAGSDSLDGGNSPLLGANDQKDSRSHVGQLPNIF